jgi:CMP-N-acetylneuraminic acid synthetase
MRKVFTIIKARSERVPNKNFLDVGGKPLWRWLIDELSDFQVYINTDSDELYHELERFEHVVPIRRSEQHIEWEKNAEHRGSPVMDMVREFCEDYLQESEDFALVHVTSPFLKAQTLEAAFKLYEQSDFHSLHSVKKIQDCVMSQNVNDLQPMNFTFNRIARTQDLEPIYQSLGAFFILNSNKLRRESYNRLNQNSKVIPVSALEALEIDNADELELVRLVALSIVGKKL